jgi:hypothetical protein
VSLGLLGRRTNFGILGFYGTRLSLPSARFRERRAIPAFGFWFLAFGFRPRAGSRAAQASSLLAEKFRNFFSGGEKIFGPAPADSPALGQFS